MDIGLVYHLMRNDRSRISTLPARTLKTERQLSYADMRKRAELDYWLREEQSSNTKVDYVISQGGLFFSIEVKPGGSVSSRHVFPFHYSPI